MSWVSWLRLRIRLQIFITTFQLQVPPQASHSCPDFKLVFCASILRLGVNTTPHRLFPCPHLLHNNNPPSELEVHSIRQVISEAKTDREHLQLEIAKLWASMDALRNQSNAVEAFITEHEATLTPARRILPEIFSEISLWYLTDGQREFTSADNAIVLGQVRRYWRSVAVSTPNLWAYLLMRWMRGPMPSLWRPLSRDQGLAHSLSSLSQISRRWQSYLDACLKHSSLEVCDPSTFVSCENKAVRHGCPKAYRVPYTRGSWHKRLLVANRRY